MLAEERRFFMGLDLGQSQDPTAVALVERELVMSGPDSVTWLRTSSYRYGVRGVRRLPLGKSYPELADEVCELIEGLPQEGKTTLVVDATGVGAPVVDLLRRRLPPRIPIVPVVFTGGDSERFDNGTYRVPKKDLVHGLVVLLQEGKLKIAERSPHAGLLIGELANMRLKISADGHASYEAWRQGQHDDLVFALALACWRARRGEKRTLGQARRLL